MKTLVWVLTLAYSLAPFKFAPGINPTVSFVEPLDATHLLDLAFHMAAFAGIGLIDRAGRGDVRHSKALDVRVLALGLFFCFAIESAQAFAPARHAALADLIVNVSGLIAGHLIAPAVRGRVCRLTASRPSVSLHGMPIRMAVWGLLWGTIILIPARLVRLDQWNLDYPLLVGDEKGGGRAWEGEIRYVGFYGSALTDQQLDRLHQVPPSSSEGTAVRREDGLLLAYDFATPSEFDVPPDGRLGDSKLRLVTPAGLRWRGTPSALMLDDGSAIASAGSADQLSASITSRHAFSLEVWLRPATLAQVGPARIVSISEDPYRRNFTLGQEGRALHVRIRNGLNGVNGDRYALICEDALTATFQQVVVMYQQGVSRVFRDGEPMCAVDLREPSVLLGLGRGGSSHFAVALIAALSFLVAAGSNGPRGLVALLVAGYAWLLAAFLVGLLLAFSIAPSLYFWFGPLLVGLYLCMCGSIRLGTGCAGQVLRKSSRQHP